MPSRVDKHTAFAESLERGQLVAAMSLRPTGEWRKTPIHLVTIRARSDGYSLYWTGVSLCGVDGTTPRSAYYWSVQPEPGVVDEMTPECQRCWAELGRRPGLVIRGWQDASTDGGKPLPYAWRAVAVTGHPRDVAEDADPDDVRDGAGKVVGVRRQELQRWQRGPCVVRIVRNFDDPRRPFEVRFHNIGAVNGEKPYSAGTESKCVERAWTLMAQGGSE